MMFVIVTCSHIIQRFSGIMCVVVTCSNNIRRFSRMMSDNVHTRTSSGDFPRSMCICTCSNFYCRFSEKHVHNCYICNLASFVAFVGIYVFCFNLPSDMIPVSVFIVIALLQIPPVVMLKHYINMYLKHTVDSGLHSHFVAKLLWALVLIFVTCSLFFVL